MGQEIECRAVIDGRPTTGKALLETEEVLFRGEIRARLPFRELTAVEVEGGRLTLRTSDHVACFELDAGIAEKWAHKIRNPRTLLDKLGVKAGQVVAVVGPLDDDFVRQLGERGATVVAGDPPAESDIVFLYAPSTNELTRLLELKAAIKRNGAIWVVSPKGDRSIQDIHVMAAAREAGLVDTKVAKFSDTLTSLKLVIPVKDR